MAAHGTVTKIKKQARVRSGYGGLAILAHLTLKHVSYSTTDISF
jgi:hypothetical protein